MSILDISQSRQRQYRLAPRSRIRCHLRHFHRRHRFGAQFDDLAVIHNPISGTAMPNGVDVPVSVLEFNFLFFLIQQASVNAGIDTDIAGIDHAPETGLEQGLFGTLEDIVSACQAV